MYDKNGYIKGYKTFLYSDKKSYFNVLIVRNVRNVRNVRIAWYNSNVLELDHVDDSLLKFCLVLFQKLEIMFVMF